MNKYFSKKIESAILHGLEPGEFVITNIDEHKTLIISLPRSERKDTSVSFTAFVFDAVKYGENTMLETGFYPVRYKGGVHFGFYHNEVIYVITSSYARHVKYGELLDLDRSRFENEVLKHLNHEAAENRQLRKELKDLREKLEKAPEKESSINDEDEIDRRIRKRVERGLKYEAPKANNIMSSLKDDDDDDDDLY